jgi:hypothetical protein
MEMREVTQSERDHARWRAEHGHWRKDVQLWSGQHEHLRRILGEVADLLREFDLAAVEHQREIAEHEDQMLVHDERHAPETRRLYRRWCEACAHVHEAESDGHLIAKLEHCGLERLHRGIMAKLETARAALT